MICWFHVIFQGCNPWGDLGKLLGYADSEAIVLIKNCPTESPTELDTYVTCLKTWEFILAFFSFEYEHDIRLLYRSKDIVKRWRLVFAICLNFTLRLIGIPSITTNKNSKSTAISLKPSPNKAATDRLSSFRWVPSWMVEPPTAAVAAAGGCHRSQAQLWTSPPGSRRGGIDSGTTKRAQQLRSPAWLLAGELAAKTYGQNDAANKSMTAEGRFFRLEKERWASQKDEEVDMSTEWSDRWDFEKNLWVV